MSISGTRYLGSVKLLIGKRRGRLDVIEDILKVADDPRGANKTRLVYRSNLNFNRLSAFLDFLLKKEFLEKNIEENTYSLTAKGREFLRQLEKMQDLI